MSDQLAFLSWYLAITAVGALALPIGWRLFARLPDRGYTLARPLGLLLSAYAFWLLGSLGLLRNEAGSVMAAALIVLALGLVWARWAGLRELVAWLRTTWRVVLASEVLFVAAFAALTWVRAYNPAILGTEKPMEFMFINSILNSPTFPPHDAWLSGYAISYYYFGYVMIAMLIHVTGVAASVAFNLGIALLFALSVSASFGVALNVMALATDRRTNGHSDERSEGQADSVSLSVRPSARLSVRSSVLPALLAPLIIIVAGNFYGPLALAYQNGIGAEAQVPAVYYEFGELADPNNPDAGFSVPPGAGAGMVNVWEWLDLKVLNGTPRPAGPEFNWDAGGWWFFAARVTHDRNLLGNEIEAITEVPAFSFVLGDMHPHVLGLPFVFLAMAVALMWMREVGERQAQGWFDGAWSWADLGDLARFGLTVILIGGLGFLNTWDFPIYVFVVVLSVALGLGLRFGWDGLLERWQPVVLFAMALFIGGFLLYLPFYIGFQSQAGGILPNLVFPTRFQQTVVLFSHVLIGAVLWLGWLAWTLRRAIDKTAALWAGLGTLGVIIALATLIAFVISLNPELRGLVEGSLAPLSLNEAVNLVFLRRLIDSFTTLLMAGMLGLAVGLAVGLMRRRAPAAPVTGREGQWPDGVAFTLVLLITGALLILGPEWVYLRDNFGNRMNTVFKLYYQAWAVWGVAAAVGLWWIVRQAGPAMRVSAATLSALAIGASLLYTLPASGTVTGWGRGDPTLDGTAFFAASYPDDWAAAQWLQANAANADVIIEAAGGAYELTEGRMATLTGRPIPMGWSNHEGQWRGADFANVSVRSAQIAELYTSRDAAAAQALLDLFGARFVVVGSTEYRMYNLGPNTPQVRKFEDFMRPVFQSGTLTIFERTAIEGAAP
jgi:YYY domain-containing protein